MIRTISSTQRGRAAGLVRSLWGAVSREQGGSALLVGVALVGAPVFIVVLLLILLGGGATPPPSPCGPGGSSPGMGALRVAGIPANYVPLVQKAGTVCPEMPAPVIAAQLDQESGFSDPTSSTGRRDRPSSNLPPG